MAFPGMTAPKLDDLPIGVRPRLAALWTGLMFCFIYADILGLYDPWLIGEILKGNMGPVGPITQELKFAVAMLMEGRQPASARGGSGSEADPLSHVSPRG